MFHQEKYGRPDESVLVQCLTNDCSYFEQEKTAATETKTLFSLFPHVRNTSTEANKGNKGFVG